MKKNKLIWLDFGIPVMILFLGTILFNIFNWDISIQKYFYSTSQGWIYKNTQPWQFLYDYGNIPVLILSVSSLILLAVSFFKNSLIKYRKIFFFLVLVMGFGPGLFINSILKDNWGRPRPRDIVEFDGNYRYEKVLEIDPSSKGKSFPCGPASMGFYLMTLYFIFRNRKDLTARRSLYLGIIYGGLIGFARIVQGGHFASDVIWAGGITYLISAGIFYILKMEKSVFVLDTNKPLPIKRNVIVFILIIASIVLSSLIIMADSHHYDRIWNFDADSLISEINVKIERGDVELMDSENLTVKIEYVAHGFPWSKIKTKVKKKEDAFSIKQRESGYFTEVDQTITISLPDSMISNISVEIEEGNLILDEYSGNAEIETELRKGRVIK